MKNIFLPPFLPPFLPLLTSLVFAMPTILSADDVKWSYNGETGPEKWAGLSPDYALCGSGKNQSPINIDSKTAVDAQDRGVKFNYGLITPGKIKNTGNLIQVEVEAGTNIQVDGVEFELKHLNFHMPSENTVNEKHFPMEIQFIHESKTKERATVSMMLIPGKPDRTLRKLLEQLPLTAGESKPLATNALRNMEKKKKLGNYYRYSGSMTTPPCTEGVRWFIMKDPLTLSNEQQEKFKSAIKQDNNRPVQALNARMVFE